MFDLIDIGERADSGSPNIFRVWREQGWTASVIFESIDPDRIVLSLAFKKSDDKTAQQKNEIISHLTDYVSAKNADIAELLSVKSKRIKQLLKELLDNAVIVAEGSP